MTPEWRIISGRNRMHVFYNTCLLDADTVQREAAGATGPRQDQEMSM
ncbi:rCG43978 [Rattus norvegicus]|uniref:RCG43978 n=1 Tax=Rattus norvegicus TaxID=10116 RepID=A6J6R1_RAT|nr:rCG43978 [Rattus norvegicus]